MLGVTFERVQMAALAEGVEHAISHLQSVQCVHLTDLEEAENYCCTL